MSAAETLENADNQWGEESLSPPHSPGNFENVSLRVPEMQCSLLVVSTSFDFSSRKS